MKKYDEFIVLGENKSGVTVVYVWLNGKCEMKELVTFSRRIDAMEKAINLARHEIADNTFFMKIKKGEVIDSKKIQEQNNLIKLGWKAGINE